MFKRMLSGILLVVCLAMFSVPGEAVDNAFVGNKKSKKYHLTSCKSVPKIKPENIMGFNSSTNAQDAGYKPCKMCDPDGKKKE